MSNENSEVTRYTGRVKWFNKRSGYGFVTVSDGDRVGDDGSWEIKRGEGEGKR